MCRVMTLAALLGFTLVVVQCGNDVSAPDPTGQSVENVDPTQYDDPFLGDAVAVTSLGEHGVERPVHVDAIQKVELPFLRRGDLVFCEFSPAIHLLYPETNRDGYDYVAIYNRFRTCIGVRLWVDNPKVGIISLPELRLVSDPGGLKYGRVSGASQEQTAGAIEFCLSVLGDEFQDPDVWECVDHDRFNEDPQCPPPNGGYTYRPLWYDSELVWAAWYRQGFDLADVGSCPYPCVEVTPGELLANVRPLGLAQQQEQHDQDEALELP